MAATKQRFAVTVEDLPKATYAVLVGVAFVVAGAALDAVGVGIIAGLAGAFGGFIIALSIVMYALVRGVAALD